MVRCALEEGEEGREGVVGGRRLMFRSLTRSIVVVANVRIEEVALGGGQQLDEGIDCDAVIAHRRA